MTLKLLIVSKLMSHIIYTIYTFILYHTIMMKNDLEITLNIADIYDSFIHSPEQFILYEYHINVNTFMLCFSTILSNF